MPGRRAAEQRGGSRLRAGQPEDSQTHCPGQQLTPVGLRCPLSVPFSFSSPGVSAHSRWVERGRPRPAGGGEVRRPCAEGRPGACCFPAAFCLCLLLPFCRRGGGRGAAPSASVRSFRVGGGGGLSWGGGWIVHRDRCRGGGPRRSPPPSRSEAEWLSPLFFLKPIPASAPPADGMRGEVAWFSG